MCRLLTTFLLFEMHSSLYMKFQSQILFSAIGIVPLGSPTRMSYQVLHNQYMSAIAPHRAPRIVFLYISRCLVSMTPSNLTHGKDQAHRQYLGRKKSRNKTCSPRMFWKSLEFSSFPSNFRIFHDKSGKKCSFFQEYFQRSWSCMCYQPLRRWKCCFYTSLSK